jgi:tripartite-type tricarboxylate transporter receptor subunit TctC
MKRTTKTAVALGILLAFLAVGYNAAAGGAKEAPKAADFPGGKPVTLIVPWTAGGGSDIGARMVEPYLEEYLKTTVNVINPTGASGWIGWEQLLNGKADGYTIAMVNFPTLIPGYMDPALGRKHNLDSFAFLANHVTDASVIAIRKDEKRFTDLKSFVEYAKKNDVTASTSGNGSDDHVLLETVNAKAGTRMVQVPGNGWKDGYAALLGGHIDCSIANVGEVLVPIKNNELVCIAVFDRERSNFFPQVPTWKEVMGSEIYVSSQRGFAAKAGTPQEILNKLAEALKYGITNKDQIAKMAAMGLKVDYIGPAEYTKLVKEQEAVMQGMAGIMGWKK